MIKIIYFVLLIIFVLVILPIGVLCIFFEAKNWKDVIILSKCYFSELLN